MNKEKIYEDSDDVEYKGHEYEFIQCDPDRVGDYIGKDGWQVLAMTLTNLESTAYANLRNGEGTVTTIVEKVGFWRIRAYYFKKDFNGEEK